MFTDEYLALQQNDCPQLFDAMLDNNWYHLNYRLRYLNALETSRLAN